MFRKPKTFVIHPVGSMPRTDRRIIIPSFTCWNDVIGDISSNSFNFLDLTRLSSFVSSIETARNYHRRNMTLVKGNWSSIRRLECQMDKSNGQGIYSRYDSGRITRTRRLQWDRWRKDRNSRIFFTPYSLRCVMWAIFLMILLMFLVGLILRWTCDAWKKAQKRLQNDPYWILNRQFSWEKSMQIWAWKCHI
jgi:hypothetical protein